VKLLSASLLQNRFAMPISLGSWEIGVLYHLRVLVKLWNASLLQNLFAVQMSLESSEIRVLYYLRVVTMEYELSSRIWI
jgi:hypothetical protein